MANKGDILTQRQYEDEVELRELYKEAYLRGEIPRQKMFCKLVNILGFGQTMANSFIIKWKKESKLNEIQNETPASNKIRLKKQMSLEKKCITRRDRKKRFRIGQNGEKIEIERFDESQRKCSDCKYNKTCNISAKTVL